MIVVTRRKLPEGTMSDKVRELMNRALDWVWAHPGTHFEVHHVWTDLDRYFEWYCMDEDGAVRCAEFGGNKYWSKFQPCTEENLETLLAILETNK